MSRDGERTWIDRRETIVDDVHRVLPISEDAWLATTGYLDHNLETSGLGRAVGVGGLYRTTDAGDSWSRIEDGSDFSYIRRVFVQDGTVFFCGGEEAPPAWVNGLFFGTTRAVHGVWTVAGRERHESKIDFLKDLALLGGAIVLDEADGNT